MDSTAPSPLAIVVRERPRSLQAERLEGYRARITAEAVRTCSLAQSTVGAYPWPSTQRLYVRIVWFRSAHDGPDLDNIAKPIIDALKGVVFEDDGAVSRCLLRIVDTRGGAGSYHLSVHRAIPEQVHGDLITWLPHANHVLYVEVGLDVADPVTLGPPEARE